MSDANPQPFDQFAVLSSLYHVLQHLARKMVVAAVIGLLAIFTYATWLFLQDKSDFTATRERQLAQLTQEKSALVAQRAALASDVSGVRRELETQQRRVDRSAAVIVSLTPLLSRWERWFGDRDEQENLEKRISKMRDVEVAARARVLILQSTATSKDWSLSGLDTQISQINAEIAAVSRIHSWVWHYLISAWFNSRWFLLAAVIVYFVGAPLRRACFFVFISPLLSHGKSLRFKGQVWDVAEIAENRQRIEVELWPGERLRVRREFERSGDEGLTLRKRFFLNGRFPIMCLFGGLTRLAELHHTRAREARVVTIASAPERELDFAMFNVPEGGSLLLRARYLAGVVLPANQKLKVRARWRLLDRHAWAGRQLRFLEFCGPCRLVVASRRALRVSHVPASEAAKKPSRVTERRRIIGFSPSLEFSQVRNARFWRYIFSGRELLDGRFVGAGLMLSEEPLERVRRRRPPLIRSMWNNLIDAFGY